MAGPPEDDQNSTLAESLGGPTLQGEGPLGRFEDLGQLGVGGTSEVRRVRDPVLGRVVALKILDPRRDPSRFLEEARIVAQLEHPSIVPVHETGTLADGRHWFAMREVRGRTLGEVIRGVHLASVRAGAWAASEGWTLRRLLGALRQVGEAVAYAHARGVIHRDLKPSNVMVGEFGEVFVLDWGVGKVLDQPEAERIGRALTSARGGGSSGTWTRDGVVVGTPFYMSPEQARGQLGAIGKTSDVWSLGAVLHEVLTGRPPLVGRTFAVIERLRQPEPIPPRVEDAPGPVDDALWALCAACLRPTPEERPPDGQAFADVLRSWLDGVSTRERAHALVAEAVASFGEADRLRGEAAALREGAGRALSALAHWAPEVERHGPWADEDRAQALERAAALAELDGERRMGAALAADPQIPEAHVVLAGRYRAEHDAAERMGDERVAARALALVELHAEALPASHPARAPTKAWARGDAAITLVTDPPGADVVLEQYTLVNRRLVATPVRELGATPLVELPVPSGSWRLRIRAAGRPAVSYPVHVRRGEHWDGVAPGGDSPFPVLLPASLPPGVVYVTPGWFLAGRAGTSRSPRRLWCHGFAVGAFPVTMAEACDWLNALLAEGREAEALRHAPRAPIGRYGDDGPLVLERDGDGRFFVGHDADGDRISPHWPAVNVDWQGAVAYAAWKRAQTGLPWRLLSDLEWEKAAGGVDGRLYPWGNHGESTWCNCRDAGPRRETPVDVDSFPVDESPYGLRGAGGNVRDWTSTPWADGWAEAAVGDRVLEGPLDPPPPIDERAVGRGGAWPVHIGQCTLRTWAQDRIAFRHPGVAFRIGFSV